MGQAMPSLANISWDRLEREDSVTYPCLGPEEKGQEIVFGDVFPTSRAAPGWSRPACAIPPRCRTTTSPSC
jgi:formate dehydrogenase major subunit